MKKLIHYRKPRRGEKGLVLINDVSSGGGGGGQYVSSSSSNINRSNKKTIEFKKPTNTNTSGGGGASNPSNITSNKDLKKAEPRGWDVEPEREVFLTFLLTFFFF
jgi:hypothetical protein